MIRKLKVARSLVAHYMTPQGASNGPTIKFFSDGTLVKTFSDIPTHGTYTTRTLTVPDGVFGYIFHTTSSSDSEGNVADIEVVAEDVQGYGEQILWHYYDITFKGTINVSVYLDGSIIRGDGDGLHTDSKQVTLTTDKPIDSKRVYLPPLSYGRIPHVMNDSNDTGTIFTWEPVALPAIFYKSLETATEGKITYKGEVTLAFFYDGVQIGDEHSFLPEKSRDTGEDVYTTKAFYLGENSGGQVFQYEQTSGDGNIISLQTNAHKLDFEEATQGQPE